MRTSDSRASRRPIGCLFVCLVVFLHPTLSTFTLALQSSSSSSTSANRCRRLAAAATLRLWPSSSSSASSLVTLAPFGSLNNQKQQCFPPPHSYSTNSALGSSSSNNNNDDIGLSETVADSTSKISVQQQQLSNQELQTAKDETNNNKPTASNKNNNNNMAATLVKIIGKTTSILVAGAVFVALAYFRNAMTFSLFVGSVSNGILSKVLKRVLKQSRPVVAGDADTAIAANIPDDNGMPSSHAMSLGFIGIFAALSAPWSQVAIAVYVVLSLIYRVQARLHTWEQVLVGSLVGTTNGYIWYQLTTGNNPWNVNFSNWITQHILDPTTGQLPLIWLPIAVVVGGLTVSSFERKISTLLKQYHLTTTTTTTNNDEKAKIP